MLKIQVLGKGMIPRGYGLAPRKEFFKADLTLIHTILITPGLKVNAIAGDKIVELTKSNVKKIWDKYRSDVYKQSTEPAQVELTEEVKVEEPVKENKEVKKEETKKEEVKQVVTPSKEEKVVETKKEEVKSTSDKEEKVEETKEESKKEETTTTIKPVTNDNKGNNNHNNKK